MLKFDILAWLQHLCFYDWYEGQSLAVSKPIVFLFFAGLMATLMQPDSRRLYSWWWDSHISPKNSKWLQENLTDMDAKVKAMIKLIEEDADSFARRAEMYYKKRPELMKLVEEFYRAYRALAERYDHATGELRQAHRTISEAFPNQVPFVLSDDSSPSGDPTTPQSQFQAFLNSDEVGSNSNGVQRNGCFLEDSESGISRKGLKQLSDIFGSAEMVVKMENYNDGNLRDEKDVENEIQTLKEALVKVQAEKEAVILQYEQSTEKFANMERELNLAKESANKIDEEARKAEALVQSLKDSLFKSEAERDAAFLQHKLCLEKISNLNDKAGKAEIESQNLKQELLRSEAEKEAGLTLYKQCLDKISDLDNKITLAENDAKILNEQTERANDEVATLQQALAKLSEEKEEAVRQYEICLETISKLEREVSRALEENRRLKEGILMGSEKLRNAEEQCHLLEKSNQSLQSEAVTLAEKMKIKDQELSQRQEELEKLHIHVKEEHTRFIRVESSLEILQNLHSQSQLELKSGFQMLKELEICKQILEEEIRRVREENKSLNDMNSISTVSIKNLLGEISSLKEIKGKLEEEILLRVEKTNSFQKEIDHLKQEIEGITMRHQALVEQTESVGFSPERLGSSVRNLQDENLRLKEICKEEKDEKNALFEKLGNMENKNSYLESSLLDSNARLEKSKEKYKEIKEAYRILQGEKSDLAAEKTNLFSQLQIITVTMEKLMEKNVSLDTSLFGANSELEKLRGKYKSLEESFTLLENEKSDLLDEKCNLVSQLENVEERLENLEKRFTELEKKYAGLQKEKESTVCQMEELRVSLSVEKEERTNFMLSTEARLAGMENHIHLLQEENRWRKKEFEEELDRAINAQLEIFILQSFMQDLEEKNFSLLMECQKHIETSKLSEKFITEMERENLEQQVEIEFLFDEIQKLRTGIYQVLKALEVDSSNNKDHDMFETVEIHLPRILSTIKELKCSLLKNKDEKEHLLIENLVLLSLIGQLTLEGKEIESEKKITKQEFGIITEQLRYLQVENSKIIQENRSLLKEFSDLKDENPMLEEENSAILSVIFKCYESEKALKIKGLTDTLDSVHGDNSDLKRELEMKETENLHLKEKLEILDKEIDNIAHLNDQLDREILIGKDSLSQKEMKLSEAEEKLKATENMNAQYISILQTTIEESKRQSEDLKFIKGDLEKQIFELNLENGNLESELGMLHKEVEERRIREENLICELQERSSEFELWESEAESFYFDLQISSISEVLYKDKVYELRGVCEGLKNETGLKSVKIENLKERVSHLEGENERLKAQLSAFVPVIVSLTDSFASLEQNGLYQSETDYEKVKDEESEPDGISVLKMLQTRIEEAENAMAKQKEKLATKGILESNARQESGTSKEKGIQNEKEFDELSGNFELQCTVPETTDVRSGIQLKDIPLDQISDSSFHDLRSRTRGSDDQMLELWEENSDLDASFNPMVNKTHTSRLFEGEGQKSEISSGSQVEKELGVDNLEKPTSFSEPIKEGKKINILEKIASDAQKLKDLQLTAQELRRKVETKKKNKKGEDVDYESVRRQLVEVEEGVSQLVDVNGGLLKNIQVGSSSVKEKDLIDFEEARSMSEKMERFQLELQEIQYVLLKLEDQKKSKGGFRISESKTTVLLRDFLHSGGRRNQWKKKGCSCGCFRPSPTITD